MTARIYLVGLVTFGLAAAAAGAGFAQAPPPAGAQAPPMAGVVFKNKAPVSGKLLALKLPRPQEADLPNGLHVMVLEDRRAPQVTMQLSMRGAGGYYDPVDHAGLAQFTAANLREGTATKSTTEISEQLDRLSATLNVTAGMSAEDATIAASSLTEHVDLLLELMADVLLNPTFPDQEFARYKTQTRAQLIQQRANPGFLAQERFKLVVAGDHPDGRVSPTPAVLEKTTRNELVVFHRARYVPDHAVIAIAGDISMAEAMKKIQARLGGWQKTGTPAPRVTDPGAITKPGIYLVERPNSVQTNLIVGVQAIRRTDPDYFALALLNKVIGGGPTGRLFRNLREAKGYTYGAGSSIDAPRFRGVWVADTEVRTEVTEPALTDLLDELRQAREVSVPAKELADAKRSMIAAFALTLESPQALLNNAVTRYRFNLPSDYWDRYPERISAITATDAQAMARKYLDPSRLQIVAVGNSEGVGRALRKLGPVEVYDAEGRRITTY
ncbi:MAG: insulinase family protein [Acidobacteria bacterium]|nr:insulinase family protein [Acidobacteriota bacterium]